MTKKERQEWGRKGGLKAWKGVKKEDRAKRMLEINRKRRKIEDFTDEELLMELRRRKA